MLQSMGSQRVGHNLTTTKWTTHSPAFPFKLLFWWGGGGAVFSLLLALSVFDTLSNYIVKQLLLIVFDKPL